MFKRIALRYALAVVPQVEDVTHVDSLAMSL